MRVRVANASRTAFDRDIGSKPLPAHRSMLVASAAVLLAITFVVGRYDDASVALAERITGA
jgi:hypothetical protein